MFVAATSGASSAGNAEKMARAGPSAASSTASQRPGGTASARGTVTRSRKEERRAHREGRSHARGSRPPLEPVEGGVEPIVGVEQMLREYPRVGDRRHEVRVARPARDDVPVEMVDHPRTGARSEVDA